MMNRKVMKKQARILIVDASSADTERAKRACNRVSKNCEFRVVESRRDFLAALEDFQPDVILADHDMPHFDGMKALKLALAHSSLIPVILWARSISEDVALDCLKAGASNFVLKENSGRLETAIRHSLEERQASLARKKTEMEHQVLLEIMQGLSKTADLHEFLKLIHHSIARVIYAENFLVVLHQPDTGLFEEIYTVDKYDLPEPPSGLEKSVTSYVFRTGEPLLLTPSRFEDLIAQGEVELIGTDSASWLGVPLKTIGTTIGVMPIQPPGWEYRSKPSARP